MKSIYQKAVEALPAEDIDHHESDLYIRKTPASVKLLSEYEYKNNIFWFRDAIDNVIWYEIPFAYDPFWENRGIKNNG